MSNSINILVADDHTIVRQGLARLLEEQPDIKVIGEATNGRKAVDLAKKTEAGYCHHGYRHAPHERY